MSIKLTNSNWLMIQRENQRQNGTMARYIKVRCMAGKEGARMKKESLRRMTRMRVTNPQDLLEDVAGGLGYE